MLSPAHVNGATLLLLHSTPLLQHNPGAPGDTRWATRARSGRVDAEIVLTEEVLSRLDVQLALSVMQLCGWRPLFVMHV
jgi:hypothetical protein